MKLIIVPMIASALACASADEPAPVVEDGLSEKMEQVTDRVDSLAGTVDQLREAVEAAHPELKAEEEGEAPAEDAPAEDAPAEEAPAEDAPAEE